MPAEKLAEKQGLASLDRFLLPFLYLVDRTRTRAPTGKQTVASPGVGYGGEEGRILKFSSQANKTKLMITFGNSKVPDWCLSLECHRGEGGVALRCLPDDLEQCVVRLGSGDA